MADSHATAGAQPGACSPPFTVASGPGPTSGGVSDSDRRSGRLTVDHRLAARLLRLSSGRRRVTPIAGDRQLTVSRPAGRAVLAAVIRAGARGPVPRDPCSPETVNLSPAGQSAARLPLYSTRRRRVASLVRGCHCCTPARRLLLLASTVPWPAAGPNLARRLPLLASTVPGPAAGPYSAQAAAPPRLYCARACGRARPGSGRTPHRPAGGPRPAPATVVAISPVGGRSQTGRCGVLTRIPVGAAAVAGPGRSHSPAELAGPDPTTRHGDEAAASCSCRFPVPFGVSRALTVTSCNVLRCCTHLEGQLSMPQLSIVALPSPSLFQLELAHFFSLETLCSYSSIV